MGLCYGRPGVGKTLSARRCSRWDYFDNANPYTIPDETLAALIGVRTIFYTTPVVNTPRQIDRDIARLRSQLQFLAKEPLRREAAQKLKQINIRDNRHRPRANWNAGPGKAAGPIRSVLFAHRVCT
ncbi:MAG: ATP-binding protein [Verrucomicrobia bacterium]|nr:ATP-binding protein [Verrucomicrobiota bacterium]